MTREEEIKKIASAFAIDEVKDTCNPASKRGLLYAGFVSGAQWADQHPDIDVRTMAAWQSGYKEAVDKACDWLTRELCYTARGNNFFNNKTVTDEFVKQFKQAMKGGEE